MQVCTFHLALVKGMEFRSVGVIGVFGLQRILGVFDISSGLQSIDGPSPFNTSSFEDIVYSCLDIVSSKGPYKSLLKWYEDISKAKASILVTTFGSSSSKAKAFGSSSSKAKASLKTLNVKIPIPITNYVLGLANGKSWDVILNKTFRVKIPTAITGVEEKKWERVLGLANGKT
ncbi:hypothetical protein Tco_0538419 [Tanacetum coccineum]